MHVLVVYTSMFSYIFLAFPALPVKMNDDIVATLCIITIANAVKIIRKRQRGSSRMRQWTSLGYKGKLPLSLFHQHVLADEIYLFLI